MYHVVFANLENLENSYVIQEIEHTYSYNLYTIVALLEQTNDNDRKPCLHP